MQLNDEISQSKEASDDNDDEGELGEEEARIREIARERDQLLQIILDQVEAHKHNQAAVSAEQHQQAQTAAARVTATIIERAKRKAPEPALAPGAPPAAAAGDATPSPKRQRTTPADVLATVSASMSSFQTSLTAILQLQQQENQLARERQEAEVALRREELEIRRLELKAAIAQAKRAPTIDEDTPQQ